MNRLNQIAMSLVLGMKKKAIQQTLRLKTVMEQGAVDRRMQERERNKYVDKVGPWLQRLVGPGSQVRQLVDKLVEELPGRNVGTVLTQRKNRWVKEAKQIPEVIEFTEYIGGPDRMYSAALYVVRDVALDQILLKEGKESAERMASKWFVENSIETKANVFEEGGYHEDFRNFLPPNISFEVGPTREVTAIVETFGREKKNWATMAKKLAFIAAKFNDIVRSVKADMTSGDEVTRLCALMTAITIETGLRPGEVGNAANVKDPETGEKIEVDTFGVTTMQPRHVKFIRDNFAELRFVGKKGTEQIATLSDGDVLTALKEAVDSTSLSGDTAMLFVTKGGQHVDYQAMNKYVSGKWGDITPTDFRKLKATRQFYDSLKSRVQEMHQQLSKVVGESKTKLRNAVVAKIMAVLEDAAKEAQTVLNHDDWTTTIKSYVDPRVVVNFLNQGGLDDTLEDILVNGKNVNLLFNFDAFVERARRAA